VVALDRFTVVLLLTRDDAPAYDEAVQSAHLSHLADLHESGELLAAGPLRDPDGRLRGLAVLSCGPDEARALLADDPAVRAGWFDLQILPWLAPQGAVRYARTQFPRSVSDVA
jgi:uncharacterized protein YciI